MCLDSSPHQERLNVCRQLHYHPAVSFVHKARQCPWVRQAAKLSVELLVSKFLEQQLKNLFRIEELCGYGSSFRR